MPFALLLALLTMTPDSLTIYVVSYGWHAGLVLPTEPLTAEAFPPLEDFPEARYLEMGWGDRAYYMAPQPTFWMALRAALWPTPSVLHVVGRYEPLEEAYACRTAVALRLSRMAFQALVAYLREHLLLDASGHPVRLGPGLYGRRSFFYASPTAYHLFRTCNVWLAEGLRRAGLRIYPWLAVTVSQLFQQLQSRGRLLRFPCR